MSYLKFKSLYDKNPLNQVTGFDDQVFDNYQQIIDELTSKNARVIVFELYPGVNKEVLKTQLFDKLNANEIIDIENYTYSENILESKFKNNITDDRVFGLMSHHSILDYYDPVVLNQLRDKIDNNQKTVIYGFGASLIKSDILVQVSITRWEIQLRYRKGMPNFKLNNHNEDPLRKYKRGYFLEWRVADRVKESIQNKQDYIIDLNNDDKPVMVAQEAYQKSLDLLLMKPFRMVPYFDPGIWGGQWMKEACGLDQSQKNYAWSFDGVPEENSIKFSYDGKVAHFPAQDLVLFRTRKLLGERVHGRFGKQFPIRFDLLDTFEGGNLSLQVHPLTEYIYEKFGMSYTQDESYYILDTKEDGNVYLGFKNDVDQEAFKKDLMSSTTTGFFDADKYVNAFPVKKHDHLSIPAGTIHCSGRNTMVLEISACVYIFTFKLYDWGRLGLDGVPRPVHLEHGFRNLQFSNNRTFVEKELFNPFKKVSAYEEITGLHQREFLQTRRATFGSEPVELETFGSVNMANLVEGQSAIIESIDGSFSSFEIHYAETIVIPATINKFRIRAKNPNETCMLLKAHVR